MWDSPRLWDNIIVLEDVPIHVTILIDDLSNVGCNRVSGSIVWGDAGLSGSIGRQSPPVNSPYVTVVLTWHSQTDRLFDRFGQLVVDFDLLQTQSCHSLVTSKTRIGIMSRGVPSILGGTLVYVSACDVLIKKYVLGDH